MEVVEDNYGVVMRSKFLEGVSRSFKDLPNSEKVRLSEKAVDKSLGFVDKVFSSVFSPEIKRHEYLDRSYVRGFHRINDKSLRRSIIALEEDD